MMLLGIALLTPRRCTAVMNRWCSSGVHTSRCFFTTGAAWLLLLLRQSSPCRS